MKMDGNNSDQSPPLSENQGESWLNCWDNEDSSVSGLNLAAGGLFRSIAGGGPGLHDLVEDKEVAARAVAFVVNSTRKGIVPLCADVASLLRSKKVLENKVVRLRCENESLRSSRSGSAHTSHSTSPPASVNSAYSDRGSHPHERSSRPCSRCSSHCSSLVSNSPKFDKTSDHKRSPRFSRSSSFFRTSNDNENANQQVTVALVHTPCNGQTPLPGSSPHHGHERKGSLPHIVSEPNSSVPKVNPHSQRRSVHVQCDGQTVDPQIDEQLRETVKLNSKLSDDLGAAKKEIEALKKKLKEMEMRQLAIQCLHQTPKTDGPQTEVGQGTLPSKDAPLSVPLLQRVNSTSKSCGSHRSSSPILVPSPLDGCLCVNCKDTPATQSTLVIPPRNGLKTSHSGHLQLEVGDHVVVRDERTGHVRYIGHLDHITPPDAIFVGLELDAPVGRHDGKVNGTRYFQCGKDQAVFVPLQDILSIIAKQTLKPVGEVSVRIEMEKKSERKPEKKPKPERLRPLARVEKSDKTRYPSGDNLKLPREKKKSSSERKKSLRTSDEANDLV